MQTVPVVIFRALGHPDRLAVFELIWQSSGDCCPEPSSSICACDIARRVGLSASMVSRHLRELRLANLIRTEKRRQWVHCTVNPDALGAIEAFLRQGGAPSGPGAGGTREAG